MQFGSGSNLSTLSGSQIALRVLHVQSAAPTLSPKAREVGAASGDINSLLAYAKRASAIATNAPTPEPVYDPAADLPEDWSMGAMVLVDSLAPVYRDFAKSLGATHVRLYGPDTVSDAEFTQKVSTYLDDAYGGDAAYLAAKAAGQVSITRQSDVLAGLGDTQAGDQMMAFFRGPNGSEYFGSGGTGAPSAAFDNWSAAQTAAGKYLAVGGTMGRSFVASWAAA